MKKSLIKSLLLIIIFIFSFLISCDDNTNIIDNNYKIEYELNGGTTITELVNSYDGSRTVSLPTLLDVVKSDFEFYGWYDNKELEGETIKYIKKGETGDKKFFAKWIEPSTPIIKNDLKFDINPNNYNLGAITINILVDQIEEYDPTNSLYTKEDKNDRIIYLSLIQKSYMCKIKYQQYLAEWGPARIIYIKDNCLDKSFFKDSDNLTYIINIDSRDLPIYIKSESIVPLYNMETDEGLFKEFNYEQDENINKIASLKNIVYGYSNEILHPDNLLFYNVELLNKHNLEDPLELWYKGKWTWSKFVEWSHKAQEALGKDGYALDMSYFESMIGFVAAQGQYLYNPTNKKFLFTESPVTNIVDNMLALNNDNLWDPAHGMQEVSKNFINGKNLMHNGTKFLLCMSYGFNKNQDLKLGCVPYPTKDDENPIIITKPYSYIDSLGNKVSITEPIKNHNGKIITDEESEMPIYGIDLTKSEYRIPITYTEDLYAILNNHDKDLNYISPDIIFSILHDLVSSVKVQAKVFKISEEKQYEKIISNKLDYDVDVDLIMSLHHSTNYYYDPIVNITRLTDGCITVPNFYVAMDNLIKSHSTSCFNKFLEIKPDHEYVRHAYDF